MYTKRDTKHIIQKYMDHTNVWRSSLSSTMLSYATRLLDYEYTAVHECMYAYAYMYASNHRL